MSDDICHNELQQVADVLANAGFYVSMQGDDSARIVFAESGGGRAIEVYREKVAFCVGCFLPEEKYSSVELRGISFEVATQRALEWLRLG